MVWRQSYDTSEKGLDHCNVYDGKEADKAIIKAGEEPNPTRLTRTQAEAAQQDRYRRMSDLKVQGEIQSLSLTVGSSISNVI